MNKNSKNFALVGAAGYIAPRHMQAIKDTGNNLIAILDKNDSVGIIDSYFPQALYFSEFERFDRYLANLIHLNDEKLDYMSICTPNHLHDAHIRLALRNGANAICEKPLVLNPWNLESLANQEKHYKQKVYTILQLRYHPSIIALKEKVEREFIGNKWDIDLSYITSRGAWYLSSWKGDIEKSGGLATNIGIHFFDVLQWIFGNVVENKVYLREEQSQAGFIEFDKARVRWYLSVDAKKLPTKSLENNERVHRSMKIDGEEFEFSDGFTNLHTHSYQEILRGNGFGLNDAAPSINIVSYIRNAELSPIQNDFSHPFLYS